MKKYLSIIVLLAIMLAVNAQEVLTREQMGGVYYAYHLDAGIEYTPVPAGYSAVYISHYGRHGSRWLPSDNRYKWVLSHFEDSKNLTPLGRKVKKMLDKVWNNARGNGGRLTALGAKQHREIAKRMYNRFPEVFKNGISVKARSSVVDRCAKSMLAFTGQLKLMNATLDMDVKTDSSDMSWIAYSSPEQEELIKTVHPTADITPDRFISQLFKNPAKVDSPMKLMSEIHTIAVDMQDVELKLDFFPLFTDNEFKAIYNQNNSRMTLQNGNNPVNEGIPARSAISLWQNIETEADAALSSGKPSVTLRFGHDTSLYRLMSLLQLNIDNTEKHVDEMEMMDRIVPMAANLQIIFYSDDNDVLVKLLHNEREVHLPLDATDGVYYRWADIKRYMDERVHNLEHLRQLNAINTMVGTDRANTMTAGIFGKGSEEHGQTLPAVMVPNGQNNWTPQTQDTERKCVAPYYYKDSLLQGFRNSHWLVGGCTQDYGSFTVATLGGKLRLQPEERATHFSHADEISHPHYYAVDLKDEYLKTEITALSHTAMLRVTPAKDEPVHIVVSPNSDEAQGYIEIDTVNHIVYGYNPVHRIYQGWGEKAGFSGHFVLQYGNDCELTDFGVFDNKSENGKGKSIGNKTKSGAWLTFKGKSGIPMIFITGSSFTGRDETMKNIQVETRQYSLSFGDMMSLSAEKWTERLHTIDVEDKNTAKVNQFYGALYRCSFLPREMSDVDGTRLSFAGGNIKKSSTTSYGDFSQWDIYRAELPLYNIITPKRAGDMMQSLVNMYDDGGWMPIFPCWNSYTAAMIGDHVCVSLADAYIKGIRGFDVEQAYRGMRKNALKSPSSYEDYKNGMGRRALKSYSKYGYIPLEDSVTEAFHNKEQTSRTLEYAFDDFAVAQLAKALGKTADYKVLMKRSENWRNVINPGTGWADGRHKNGAWENCKDLRHRQSYITEGTIAHYTWYVPQNIKELFKVIKYPAAHLDTLFEKGLYWHGNEPCHQIAYMYDNAGEPWKAQKYIRQILNTEYNDTPGGLSGNDDAGQMSAWYVLSSVGFYPVCPSTPYYNIGTPSFEKVTFNLENGKQFVISAKKTNDNDIYIRNTYLDGKQYYGYELRHADIMNGGELHFEMTDRHN